MKAKQLNKLFMLVNMWLLTISLTAQTNSSLPFPSPPPNPNSFRLKCVYANIYTEKQRLTFYPFNKASSVKLISFKDTINTEISDGKTKSYEVVTLNRQQMVQLTDILYNYSFKGKKYEEETNCYKPRNAIIFCDDQNVEFERIELCFECSQYKKSSDKMIVGDFCVGKYELLKNLFRKVGVKYGVLPSSF